jgi:hypothetical protein
MIDHRESNILLSRRGLQKGEKGMECGWKKELKKKRVTLLVDSLVYSLYFGETKNGFETRGCRNSK